MDDNHKYKGKYKDIVKKLAYDTFEEYIKNTIPKNDYNDENIKVAFMVDNLLVLEYRIKEICYANYNFKLKKYTHLIVLGEKHNL